MSSNLAKRVLSGIPLALAGVCYIYLAPEKIFIGISTIILLLCVWEYGNAIHQRHAFNRVGLYLSSVIFFIGLISIWMKVINIAIGLMIVAGIIVIIFALANQKRSFALLGWYFLPMLWICVPLYLLTPLRFSYADHTGSNLIFLIIVIAAVNDICAYFGGTKFGKHKLAPRISPNKSVEGSIFGFIGGTVAAYGYLWFLIPEFVSNKRTLLVIVCVIMVSQIGDLFESAIKRHFGIKDSSNIIPGHGGFLDRFDSYLFAIPVFLGLWRLLLV